MQGESNSITNQKKILDDFARMQGVINVFHFEKGTTKCGIVSVVL
jgi:hypothetical protein